MEKFWELDDFPKGKIKMEYFWNKVLDNIRYCVIMSDKYCFDITRFIKLKKLFK